MRIYYLIMTSLALLLANGTETWSSSPEESSVIDGAPHTKPESHELEAPINLHVATHPDIQEKYIEVTLKHPLAPSTDEGRVQGHDLLTNTIIALDVKDLRITLSKHADSQVSYLSNVIPKLSSLEGLSYTAKTLRPGDLQIIGLCTQLTRLNLTYEGHQSPYLKSLGFGRLTNLTDLTLLNLKGELLCIALQEISQLPKLKSLKLRRLSHLLSNRSCDDFSCLDCFKTLEEFSLAIFNPKRELRGEGLYQLPLPSLRKLELKFNGDITEQLVHFVSGSAVLEELSLISFKQSQILLEAYEKLIQIKSLKKLCMPNTVVNEDILILKKLKSLVFLQVKYDDTKAEHPLEIVLPTFEGALPACVFEIKMVTDSDQSSDEY